MIRRLKYNGQFNASAMLFFWSVGLFLLSVGYLLIDYRIRPVVNALSTVIIQNKGASQSPKNTTWAHYFDSEGLVLYIRCRLNNICDAGLNKKYWPTFGVVIFCAGMAFLFFGFLIGLLRYKRQDYLDDARWLSASIDQYPEVQRYIEGDKNENGVIFDPMIVKLGYVIEPRHRSTDQNPNRPLSYRYRNLKYIGLNQKVLNEHVLIYGATGTGKTSRILIHFLWAFAKGQHAVVLPDFKYPEMAGGFLEIICLFKRLGRNVFIFLPYEKAGIRIPIFDDIQTTQDGRDLAALLIQEEEYSSSDSAFYKQTQQYILGAVLKAVADSPVPNFKEVVRIMQMGLTAFQGWLNSTGDQEAISQLARFMELRKGEWLSFTTGILNALEVFDDDRVATAFSSDPKYNLDVEHFVVNGGLLYIGVGADKMRLPRGKTITKILDNWLTNRIVTLRTQKHRTGPQCGVRLMYDEFFGLGKLRLVAESSAVFRSVEISMILGIQNISQMELLYTPKQWKAISDNLGTHIVLPTGLQDESAESLSKYLGEREIFVKNKSKSADGTRHESVAKRTRRLVNATEISNWPYYLGIVKTKGTLPPALIAMMPTFDPRPTFNGLDGRRFSINNEDVHEEWQSLMGSLSLDERYQEVRQYIEELAPAQEMFASLTLKDIFNEWIRFAILDGAAFRKTGMTFSLRYATLHDSLRNREALPAIRAFINHGWIDPGQNVIDSPELWRWVMITSVGMDVLGRYAVQELNNIRFTAVYIQERKRLQEGSPFIGAGYEEAREIIPQTAARHATMEVLQSIQVGLNHAQLKHAVDLLMEHFPVVQKESIVMVAIPLALPFEQLVLEIIQIVSKERKSENNVSVDLEKNACKEEMCTNKVEEGFQKSQDAITTALTLNKEEQSLVETEDQPKTISNGVDLDW